MSETDRDRIGLSAADQAFVDRLARSWAPAPPGANRRVAFRERLDARLATRSRAPRLAALSLGCAAAALALWLALPGMFSSNPVLSNPVLSNPDGPRIATSESGENAGDALGETLFRQSVAADTRAEDDVLPEDYAAIASLLLDGA